MLPLKSYLLWNNGVEKTSATIGFCHDLYLPWFLGAKALITILSSPNNSVLNFAKVYQP
jgi:hypothetical protein